jgi:phenylacetate-CoA ligase
MYRQLYQLARSVKRREFRTLKYIRELERNQWLSPDELQQISWQKLKKLLEHAYANVPFYRRCFQEIGLTPQDIRTEEDFRQIPLLSKDDIRHNTDLLIATNYAKDKMRRDVTSGSTGTPLVLYHERDCNSIDFAAFTRCYRWFGCESGDKIAWIWGRREKENPNLTLMQRFRRERWLDGWNLTSENLRQFAEELRHWRPDIIAGYTNVIYLFAEYLASKNITDIRPKLVQTTAMPIGPHERALIEQIFKCPVSDRYSSHEAGAIISVECPEGSRHIFNDVCYVEIIRDKRPVPPGEMGEVIITPLYSFGMPLIRYRMADVATYANSLCTCGRGLPVLGELLGRTGSIFTLPSGRLLHGIAFREPLDGNLAIRRFRVHQYSKEKIEVFLQKGEGFDDAKLDEIRAHYLRLLGNEPVELKITITDDMPTTAAGKLLVSTSDVPATFD